MKTIQVLLISWFVMSGMLAGCGEITGQVSEAAVQATGAGVQGLEVVMPSKDAAAQTPNPVSTQKPTAMNCLVTHPTWAKPPADPALLDPPAFGYYYVNADRSIWASAYWPQDEDYRLQAGEEGNKMGWFRPAGADIEISGRRLDAKATKLHADFPCCYPTRFQASGLYFPSAGCWEVTARAAKSLITFVVKVEP